MNLEELETEELARLVVDLAGEKKELAERESNAKKALADRLLDVEPESGGVYNFAAGTFRIRKAGVKETWDKDGVASATYRRAIEGTDYIDPLGELTLEPEQRVFDSMKKVFSLTPRKTPLKAMGFDLEDFLSTEGEGEYTVQVVVNNIERP